MRIKVYVIVWVLLLVASSFGLSVIGDGAIAAWPPLAARLTVGACATGFLGGGLMLTIVMVERLARARKTQRGSVLTGVLALLFSALGMIGFSHWFESLLPQFENGVLYVGFAGMILGSLFSRISLSSGLLSARPLIYGLWALYLLNIPIAFGFLAVGLISW